jgi:hypothetical protein
VIGQFELRTTNETYLPDGRFDQDGMLHAFEEIASGDRAKGFPLSRIVCRMDWAAEEKARVEDLIEFESRVNHVWERHDDAVICTYHLGKFAGDTLIDIMLFFETPAQGARWDCSLKIFGQTKPVPVVIIRNRLGEEIDRVEGVGILRTRVYSEGNGNTLTSVGCSWIGPTWRELIFLARDW